MRVILSILISILISASALTAQSLPDYSETYVNDFADILNEDQENRVRAKLIELRNSRDIEFTVVTIHSMRDYGHEGAIEPFATSLFNYWGVGDATLNNGVMMLIAVEDRHMRIEVGSGYGVTLNTPMKEIIDNAILPKFRSEAYADGIHRGVDEVIVELTGRRPGEYNATPSQRAFNSIQRFLDWLGDWIYVILAPFLAVPVQIYRRWRRNKPRDCPLDGTKMTRLDEVWDDNHLQDGQITEEQLKSVDYDVWQCPSCDHVTVEAYKAWFSSYGACRSCGYKAVEGDTTILEYATTSSTGRKRIDYHCHHCHDAWSVTRTIPRKSKSSSSSSGFGGGSSSGGGASGSW